MLFDDFFHVVIRILQVDFKGSGPVFFIQKLADAQKCFFFPFKFFLIVVTDNIFRLRFLHRSAKGVQMIKPFVAAGIHRIFRNGKHGLKFLRHQKRVAHLIFGIARMHASSVYRYLRSRRVEVFIFQFPEPAAVHRIRVIRAKQLYIKIIRARADLFVRRKPNPNPAMWNFFIVQQIFRHCHNFRDSRFIVRAEQRRSVGHNKPFPRIRRQFRKIGSTHHDIVLPVQHDILSVVILYDARPYARPRNCGRSIHMGDKSDDRRVFTARRSRHGSVYITAFFIIYNLFRSHFL